MMQPGADTINRILVALNPVARDLETLEQAAEVAAKVRAHLMALFVEDVSLFDLAQLPFARELDRASGSARPLESGAVARAMRADAERVRSALHAAAASRGINAELKVVRGHYMAAAIEAAAGCNFVFLSDVATASYPLRRPSPRGGPKPVWVLFDGSPASERGLSVASGLCRERGARLIVLLPADADLEAQRARIEALSGHDIAIEYRRLPDPDSHPDGVSAAREDCALFLVPRGTQNISEDIIGRFLKGLRCPLVLVS